MDEPLQEEARKNIQNNILISIFQMYVQRLCSCHASHHACLTNMTGSALSLFDQVTWTWNGPFGDVHSEWV